MLIHTRRPRPPNKARVSLRASSSTSWSRSHRSRESSGAGSNVGALLVAPATFRLHRRGYSAAGELGGLEDAVLLLAVRWYLRYKLSYRDLEELLAERGIEVDHVTLFRWVQRFTPLLAEAARSCRQLVEDRWFVEETDAEHDTSQHANNRAESDHSRLKARLGPMRGLKSNQTASIVIRGHAFILQHLK